MTERIEIRLLRPWQGYREGHIMSEVPVPVADLLVRQGRAEYTTRPVPELEPEPIKTKRKRRKKKTDAPISDQTTDQPGPGDAGSS